MKLLLCFFRIGMIAVIFTAFGLLLVGLVVDGRPMAWANEHFDPGSVIENADNEEVTESAEDPTPVVKKGIPTPIKATPFPTPNPTPEETPYPSSKPVVKKKPSNPNTLTSAQIKKIFKENWGKVKVCIGWGKQIDPKMSGKCVVRFVIMPNGKVSTASVVQSTLNEPKTEQCLVRRVLSMKFPPFKGSPKTVNFPFFVN